MYKRGGKEIPARVLCGLMRFTSDYLISMFDESYAMKVESDSMECFIYLTVSINRNCETKIVRLSEITEYDTYDKKNTYLDFVYSFRRFMFV